MKKIIIKIEGMGCAHCEGQVKEEIEKIKGVKNVSVSAKDEEARLEIEEFTDENELKSAIKRSGYNPLKIIKNG